MELSECEVWICRLSSLGVVQYMVVQMYTSWETELYGYLVTSCDYLSVTCGYWSRSTKNYVAMRYLVTGQLFCSTNQSQNKSNKSADRVSHECWWLHWHGHHKNMYLSISQHKNHYSVIIVPHGTSWLYSVATDPDTVHPFVILLSSSRHACWWITWITSPLPQSFFVARLWPQPFAAWSETLTGHDVIPKVG